MLTAVTARPADALVDSIGVNIHVSYTDTSYGRFSEWKSLLVDSGIRHVRDGLNDMGTTSYFYNRLKELAAAGVRLTAIPGRGNTPANTITIADRMGPDVIEAFEGQNEIINIYNANRNPAAARTYHQGWYNAVKSSSVYGDRPVYAPTFVGGNGSADELGDLTSFIDYGTLHSYAYIRPTTPSFNISGEGAAAEAISRDRAQVITETGFNSAANKKDKQNLTPTGHGKYIPRTIFEGFNAGSNRSFLYELLDQWDDAPNTNPEGQYGLIERQGSAFVAKPGYTALKNLTAVLKDASFSSSEARWNPAEFTPGQLDFDLSGQTANVHSTLLQKSDGKFYLALWQDAVSVNNSGSDSTRIADVNVPAANVTLKLNTPTSGVRIINPLTGSGGTAAAISNGRVSLSIPDSVILVEITPSSPQLDSTAAYYSFDDVNNVRGAADFSG